MKKINTAEKALLDAERTAKAIKENTEKSLRSIVSEAVADMILKEGKAAEDKDDYEVEDVNTDDSAEENVVSTDTEKEKAEEPTEDVTSKGGEKEGEKATDEPAGDDGDEDADDDDFADVEDYKVGDNDYDVTGVEADDEVFRVFNKFNKDDQVVVKKNDDGTYSIKPDESDAEYVIEFDPAVGDAIAELEDGDENTDGEDKEHDFEFEVEPDADADGDEFEFEVDDLDDTDGDESDEVELDLNEGGLGYTDNYQKNVFKTGLGMKEPADPKTTYSMEKGVPTGEEKPWAGKANDPLYKKVEESGCDETEANLEEDGQGLNTKHKMVKTQNHINRGAQNQKVVSQDGEYRGNIQEKTEKIIKKAKQLQELNEQYEKALTKLKKSLLESAVSNMNLSYMVKLMTECTMTQDERQKLGERFADVKTLKEGKNVYESVRKELKEAVKTMPVMEQTLSAGPKASINETVVFQNNPALDLMKRMENLYRR